MSTATEEKIALVCAEHGKTVSTAESCTGGLVAGTLVNAAGVSSVFREGYVTYSNGAKEKLLRVSAETLKKYGAVSWQTAAEMASGCAKAANSDFAVSTTGIAGPGGGSEEKPVGLVYIGCFAQGQVTTYRKQYEGTRQEVRKQAVHDALDILYRAILDSLGKDGAGQ